MNRSVNELESLAAKAARGAGAPPAQAARFARALVQHLAQGREADALIAALQALPAGPILTNALTPDDSDLGLSYREATEARPQTRLTLDPALEHLLAELAHKTYVPASAASREKGAGAGLTDSD